MNKLVIPLGGRVVELDDYKTEFAKATDVILKGRWFLPFKQEYMNAGEGFVSFNEYYGCPYDLKKVSGNKVRATFSRMLEFPGVNVDRLESGDFSPEEVNWCEGKPYFSTETLQEKLKDSKFGTESLSVEFSQWPMLYIILETGYDKLKHKSHYDFSFGHEENIRGREIKKFETYVKQILKIKKFEGERKLLSIGFKEGLDKINQILAFKKNWAFRG